MPEATNDRVYGPQYKLIGKNYVTADLLAKVTGRSKYAEDFRAEGMLFCKLLLSPLPHARVRHIDARDALAMLGVKAILTADDLPAPADTLTDNGTVVKASKWGERGLTMEPVYQGEPVLAVAAVDELTAAEAIEKIRIDFEPLPFVVDPLDTLRPGGPNPRTDGNIWTTPPGATGPAVKELKWTEADFAEAKDGRLPMGKTPFIGRARPGFQGRMKVGFSKEGRILALDMFVISDNGPYDAQGDSPTSGRMVSLLYQPQAMRWRGVTVLTNTPPRSAQSSPGGLQGISIIEPIIAKAARMLGLDEVAIRYINCPKGKAQYGPLVQGQMQRATSAFLKDALQRGAERFNWQGRVARSPKRIGSKVRGVGVALSCYVGGTVGFDGLLVITPEGRVRFQSGIGNLGTESVIDVHRAAAEVLGVSWEKCDVVWGDTSKHLPFTCVSGGSQTTHAMTRAAHAVAMDARQKLQEIAAKSLGGAPEDYTVANERVFRKGSAGMTLAQAARRAIELGGKYDGHEAPADVNKVTKASIASLAGQGLVAAAKDNYPRDGMTHSYVASFAEIEVDVETGKYYVVDFLAYADVGTVIHPRALGGQVLGRSILGIGHAIGQKWVFDPHYGVMVSKRFHHNKPPTILDVPVNMQWEALDTPDPETPVGARGIGEPPVGGGCASILNALSDALGDEIFRRAPVNADTILTSLEAGRPVQHPLMAHI